MELENLIGFPKDEVLNEIKKQNLDFEIIEFQDLKDFDTQLLVKFEYINNKLILYFDNFRLNV